MRLDNAIIQLKPTPTSRDCRPNRSQRFLANGTAFAIPATGVTHVWSAASARLWPSKTTMDNGTAASTAILTTSATCSLKFEELRKRIPGVMKTDNTHGI